MHESDGRAAVFITWAVPEDSPRDAVASLARGLGLHGWVQLIEDGTVCAHIEGNRPELEELLSSLRSAPALCSLTVHPAGVEGHEQFAMRGVPAGVFVVQEHQATAHHFDLRLELDDVMRSWAVPKGPSMDPAVERLAVEVEDHGVAHNDFEGPAEGGGVIVWDRGQYEQRGRVPWPQAIDRGHAVFTLDGMKLSGGFVLQRTSRGEKPQWLLVKRRDEHARPGSDIVKEQPRSVRSGVTLSELLARSRVRPRS